MARAAPESGYSPTISLRFGQLATFHIAGDQYSCQDWERFFHKAYFARGIEYYKGSAFCLLPSNSSSKPSSTQRSNGLPHTFSLSKMTFLRGVSFFCAVAAVLGQTPPSFSPSTSVNLGVTFGSTEITTGEQIDVDGSIIFLLSVN